MLECSLEWRAGFANSSADTSFYFADRNVDENQLNRTCCALVDYALEKAVVKIEREVLDRLCVDRDQHTQGARTAAPGAARRQQGPLGLEQNPYPDYGSGMMTSPEAPAGRRLRPPSLPVPKMISGDEVNPLDLTKGFASATVTLERALDDSDFQSMRYRAACKALNLKTPKAELVSFLDERVGAGQ